MARSTISYPEILNELGKRQYHPVYFFCGEEPYFIDLLADYIVDNVLNEAEKAFNQSVFYGRDTSPEQLLDQCRRYPMMADRQLVVLKEAQSWRIDQLNQLNSYLVKPIPSTILVICYKNKKLDGRTELAKNLASHSVYFESAKLYEDKIPAWISNYVSSKGYRINDKACILLTESLGTDLEKIVNEVGKLMINIPPSKLITEDLIEQYIGISKDFNIFELQKALGSRDILKANQISRYYAANPGDNPIQRTVIMLYSYFSKLMLFHSLPDKSEKSVASALGVSPFFVKDYINAARNYNAAKVRQVLSLIREYSARAVGIENDKTPPSELMHELIFRILH
jgi:DNA polymerase III subunit delta